MLAACKLHFAAACKGIIERLLSCKYRESCWSFRVGVCSYKSQEKGEPQEGRGGRKQRVKRKKREQKIRERTGLGTEERTKKNRLRKEKDYGESWKKGRLWSCEKNRS